MAGMGPTSLGQQLVHMVNKLQARCVACVRALWLVQLALSCSERVRCDRCRTRTGVASPRTLLQSVVCLGERES